MELDNGLKNNINKMENTKGFVGIVKIPCPICGKEPNLDLETLGFEGSVECSTCDESDYSFYYRKDMTRGYFVPHVAIPELIRYANHQKTSEAVRDDGLYERW